MLGTGYSVPIPNAQHPIPNTMTPLEEFYAAQPEPQRGCFLALRDFVLSLHPDIKADWKWGTPFFSFRGKMFCYFWMKKKTKEPYIGIHKTKDFEHPNLEMGKRTLIKIFRVNAAEDLPMEALMEVFEFVLKVHLK